MSTKIYAIIGILGMGLTIFWHFLVTSQLKGLLYKILTVLLIIIAAVPFFMPIFDQNFANGVWAWFGNLKW